jgi:predicted RNA-binding protein with TRAM domain
MNMIKGICFSFLLIITVISLYPLASGKPPVDEGISYTVEVDGPPQSQSVGSLPNSNFVILVRDLSPETKEGSSFRVRVADVKRITLSAIKLHPQMTLDLSQRRKLTP